MSLFCSLQLVKSVYKSSPREIISDRGAKRMASAIYSPRIGSEQSFSVAGATGPRLSVGSEDEAMPEKKARNSLPFMF